VTGVYLLLVHVQGTPLELFHLASNSHYPWNMSVIVCVSVFVELAFPCCNPPRGMNAHVINNFGQVTATHTQTFMLIELLNSVREWRNGNYSH